MFNFVVYTNSDDTYGLAQLYETKKFFEKINFSPSKSRPGAFTIYTPSLVFRTPGILTKGISKELYIPPCFFENCPEGGGLYIVNAPDIWDTLSWAISWLSYEYFGFVNILKRIKLNPSLGNFSDSRNKFDTFLLQNLF